MCTTVQDVHFSNVSLYVSTSCDIASDLLSTLASLVHVALSSLDLVMILPITLLSKLQMRSTIKWALIALFGSGIFIIVLAAVRLRFTSPTGSHHVHPKWLCVFSITEAAVAVIVSCTPILRKFFTSKHVAREPARHFPANLCGLRRNQTFDTSDASDARSASREDIPAITLEERDSVKLLEHRAMP